MKRIIFLSSAVLLAMNLMFWFILSSYANFNVAVSSAVIVCTGLLLYLTDTICLKDAFKASLTLLFTVGGVIEFVLSLFAPSRYEDNWWLIVVVGMVAFEAVLLIITNTVSNKIK